MPLPSDYSPAEHFQDTTRKTMNRAINQWFSDLPPDELDLASPRSALRTACLHQEGDPLSLTIGRQLLFDFVVRDRLNPPVYGTPISLYQESRKFKPQVMLYFQEDRADVEPGYPPVPGEISFRLMSHSSESITEAIATQLATRIKAEFASAGGYVWKKGKYMASYTDWEKGYQLQLLSRNKSEAKELIGKILDIQNHSPEWRRMNFSENEDAMTAFPTIPGTERIYGRTRRLPRSRPIADCRFWYAVLHVHALPNPVVLVDRSGLFRNPLVA